MLSFVCRNIFPSLFYCGIDKIRASICFNRFFCFSFAFATCDKIQRFGQIHIFLIGKNCAMALYSFANTVFKQTVLLNFMEIETSKCY